MICHTGSQCFYRGGPPYGSHPTRNRRPVSTLDGSNPTEGRGDLTNNHRPGIYLHRQRAGSVYAPAWRISANAFWLPERMIGCSRAAAHAARQEGGRGAQAAFEFGEWNPMEDLEGAVPVCTRGGVDRPLWPRARG